MTEWRTPLPSELDSAKAYLQTLLNNKGVLSGCTSYVQRKMDIGYNHAARIMEALEEQGFITASDEKGERSFSTAELPKGE